MTVEKLITDHIDIWSSALQTRSTAGRGSNGKIDLYGIKKLRELILELAVRGKLVPQDPNDEPASELLKRIAAEKAELVKQGKIKKQNPLPEISEDEKPFELPEGWEWVRFGNIYEMEYGDNLPQGKRTNTGEYNVYGSNGVVGTHNVACVNSPCIIIGRKGSAGALNLSLNPGCWVTDVAYSTIPPILMNLNFVYLQFHTLGLDSLGKGIKPGLNRNDAYDLAVAIPPQNEQEHIVLKVNELMVFCDLLEHQSLTSLDAHQQLVESLLITLTDSQNAEELAENWARISQRFDTLFTTEASIDALKQTILQLAVMGKLVPQDPNDEPASELLKRIEQEKAQLMKEGKIKKQKPLATVSEEEKPFESPEGWKWCRFEDIVDIQSGITKGRNLVGRVLISVPYLRVANVQRGFLDLSDIKTIEIPADEKDKYHVKSNDLLITEGGDWDTVGRTAIWTDSSFYIANQNHVFKARPINDELNVRWLEIFMNSSVSRDYFAGASKQTTNLASINKTQLRGCLIAMPPVNETARIFEMYLSLINVCETLKSHLQSTQQTQLYLADVLTDAALN